MIERAELDLPLRRANIGDLSEIGVRYPVVRISITRDVEHIEKIRTKANRLALGNVKVFEHRGINLPVTCSRPLFLAYLGRSHH
jgi:hypothetical protein